MLLGLIGPLAARADTTPPRIDAFEARVDTDGRLEQLTIRFDEPVAIPTGAITLRSAVQGSYEFLTALPDARTVSVHFPDPPDGDRLTLLVDYSVADLAGNPLDGEVLDPFAPTLPSGDGVAGGFAVFTLNVLGGDVDRNGAVDLSDLLMLLGAFGQAGPVGTLPADLDGDGVVALEDLLVVLGHFGRQLPPTDGTPPVITGRAPAIDDTYLTGGLTEVRITASEPLAADSLLPQALFALRPDGSLQPAHSATLVDGGTTLVFGFQPALPTNASYRVVLGNVITDLSGLPLSGPGPAWDFDLVELSARVLDNLEALYLFDAGAGATVVDRAGLAAPLDLEIPDPAAVTWLPGGGLAIDSPTRISSPGPATALSAAIAASGELTIEAWVRPANTTQNGPARIATLSADPYERNVTLGQGVASSSSDRFDLRLRSTDTNDNGQPSLSTPSGSLTTQLVHVVATRDVCGRQRIYLDGALAAERTQGGDLSNWDPGYRLALGEEFDSTTRSWLGEYHLLAVYSTALNGADVTRNFTAGIPGRTPSGGLKGRPVVGVTATPLDGSTPLTVQFDARQSFDPNGTITGYDWTFGDGATGTGPTPMHTYVDTGCMRATVRASGDDGLAGRASLAIRPGSSSVPDRIDWRKLSTAAGDLPPPGTHPDQTAALVFDINNDGVNDFVIGCRLGTGPSLVWYEYTPGGWNVHTIDSAVLRIEAGGAFADIDRDGDTDLVLGRDSSGRELWWWENPYPDFTPGVDWTRRLIQTNSSAQQHDQLFGDFDGDGDPELVYWNNNARALLFAEIPADPTIEPWPVTPVFVAPGGGAPKPEGLAAIDVDLDGTTDVVGAGYWFRHAGGDTFTANPIDPTRTFTRAAAGQLIAGGRPEVVFDSGDDIGPLSLYAWTGAAWERTDLLGRPSRYGHSLNVGDVDGDGHLDIFSAEMILDAPGETDAAMSLLFGDGSGTFVLNEIERGIANHESKLADLDGDGDLDILGKPFREGVPGINIWLNQGRSAFAYWQRHVADAAVPWRTIFIEHADLDGDELEDIVTGGWWWRNPGSPGGSWTRAALGAPLFQMAAVHDFDRDGDLDVLGTQAQGSDANASFAWAENDGSGGFTIHQNVDNAVGSFLQGVTVAEFQPGVLQVALSWQNGAGGLQLLTVPPPGFEITSQWTWSAPGPAVEGEGLDHGDIDGDGDLDLLIGSSWLRNDGGGSWTAFQLFNPVAQEADRNILVDMDGDGDLDAVIGYGHDTLGTLAWYEQPSDPTAPWLEHRIAQLGPAQPQSVDVADLDGDGDLDIVTGEHTNPAVPGLRLLAFENRGDDSWVMNELHAGDEHHDGAQLVDLDGDGDLDVISIGWLHRNLLVYENLQH